MYSKKNGFRIYNATRGGFLEEFERVCLEDIINDIGENHITG